MRKTLARLAKNDVPYQEKIAAEIEGLQFHVEALAKRMNALQGNT